MLENKIYQSKEVTKKGVFYNCAFVGYDENNIPRYCSLRMPSSKRNFRKDVESSDKNYGFSFKGKNNILYVFESPIDLLSHMTLFKIDGKLDWRQDNRISCGGLSNMAINTYLEYNQNIEYIVFGFDNDSAQDKNYGQEKAKELGKMYKELGYKYLIHKPINKDFNEDLIEKVNSLNLKKYKKNNEYDMDR